MPSRTKSASQRVQNADSRPIRIGCLPLVDAAPLIAAKSLGLFAKHGVTVELCWELGWAAIREGIHYRQLDCADAIAGLVFAMRAGTGLPVSPVFTPFVFNLHGNAITLSMALWNKGVRDAESLGKYVRPKAGNPVTFAAVSRFSSHYFLLRTWLQNCGLNPDRDVRIVILPPRLMPECMAAGLIDGFCAGEPWNSLAVSDGTGWCPAVSSELAPGHAEKVLLVHEAFAGESPGRLQRLLEALTESCRWCDAATNRPRLVSLLAATGHFPEGPALSASLTGPFADGTGRDLDASSFHIFHRNEANHPVADRGLWILNGLIRHGVMPRECRRRELLDLCWRAAA